MRYTAKKILMFYCWTLTSNPRKELSRHDNPTQYSRPRSRNQVKNKTCGLLISSDYQCSIPGMRIDYIETTSPVIPASYGELANTEETDITLQSPCSYTHNAHFKHTSPINRTIREYTSRIDTVMNNSGDISHHNY